MNTPLAVDDLSDAEVGCHACQHVGIIPVELPFLDKRTNHLPWGQLGCPVQVFVHTNCDEMGGSLGPRPEEAQIFAHHKLKSAGQRGLNRCFDDFTVALGGVVLSRLYLDYIENIQASWLTPGHKICQISLRFGGNDAGSILIEESVVSAAGCTNTANEPELRRLISDAAYRPVKRDTFYPTFFMN